MQEMSAGNESVGNEWIAAKTFDPNTPVFKILQWGYSQPHGAKGRLMLTEDETDGSE